MKANGLCPFAPSTDHWQTRCMGTVHRGYLALKALFLPVAISWKMAERGLLCLGADRIYSQRKTPKQSWFIFLVFPMLHTRCRDAKLAHSALTLQWAAVGWRTAGGHENARKRCLKSFCKPCRACLTAQLVRVDEGRGALTGRGF